MDSLFGLEDVLRNPKKDKFRWTPDQLRNNLMRHKDRIVEFLYENDWTEDKFDSLEWHTNASGGLVFGQVSTKDFNCYSYTGLNGFGMHVTHYGVNIGTFHRGRLV